MYRFKTEEEFIEMYGLNWMNVVPQYWSVDMNQLLGQTFEGSADFSFTNHIVYKNTWHISPEMLMPLDEKAALACRSAYKNIALYASRMNVKKNDDKELYYTITFKNEKGYNRSFNLYVQPTNNCQVASIASFEVILNECTNTKDLKDFLCALYRVLELNKRLFLVDVHQSHIRLLKEIAYSEIVQYESTNGSKMCFTMIKI